MTPFLWLALSGLAAGISISLGYITERARVYAPGPMPLGVFFVAVFLGLVALAVGGGLGWIIDPPHAPVPPSICVTETTR